MASNRVFLISQNSFNFLLNILINLLNDALPLLIRCLLSDRSILSVFFELFSLLFILFLLIFLARIQFSHHASPFNPLSQDYHKHTLLNNQKAAYFVRLGQAKFLHEDLWILVPDHLLHQFGLLENNL